MEWGTSDVIALVAAIGTILAVIVTGVSIWLTYLGSGKRLEHEAKLQTERLADERRREGLPLAAKTYRLSADVQRHIDLPAVEHWAADGEFTISVEAKASVMAAADALELVTATGWSDEVRAGAGLVLIRMMHLEHSAFATVGALQRSPQGSQVEDRFKDDEMALVEAIMQFQGAIANT